MTRSDPLLDEVWDEAPRRVITHSRLYAVEPIGVGTPLVESLTSYVMRLADAHSLTTLALLAGECLPGLRPSFYKEGKLIYCHLNNDWWQHAATTMNGLNRVTGDWVALLERLTWRRDLSHLTMLPWQPILSSRELIRRERAWCPRCYADWQTEGQALYDPLLWMLAVVTHCPQHGCQLATRCPNPDCERSSVALSSRGQPGFCGYCSGWLGSSNCDAAGTTSSDALWIAAQVGSMLAAQHDLPRAPNPEDLHRALRQACHASGGVNAFTAQLHTSNSVLYVWLKKTRAWQLASVLRVSAVTGISPLELFTGSNLPRLEPLDEIPAQFLPRTPDKPARPFDRACIEAALQAVLDGQEDPPPSLAEVARRLDYDPSFLRLYCPELCSTISARFAQARSIRGTACLERVCREVRHAVLDLHERGIRPTNQAVTALLGRGVFQEQPVFQFFVQLRCELGYY